MSSSTPSSSPTLKKEILHKSNEISKFLNTPDITPKQSAENNNKNNITKSVMSENLLKSFECKKETNKAVNEKKEVYNTPNISPSLNRNEKSLTNHMPIILSHAKNLFPNPESNLSINFDNTQTSSSINKNTSINITTNNTDTNSNININKNINTNNANLSSTDININNNINKTSTNHNNNSNNNNNSFNNTDTNNNIDKNINNTNTNSNSLIKNQKNEIDTYTTTTTTTNDNNNNNNNNYNKVDIDKMDIDKIVPINITNNNINSNSTLNDNKISTINNKKEIKDKNMENKTESNTIIHKKWQPKMIHRKRKSSNPVRSIDTSHCLSETEKCIEGIVKIEIYPIIQSHPSYLVNTPKEAEHISLESPLKLATSRRHKYHNLPHSNSQSSISSSYSYSFPRLNSPTPKTYPLSKVIRHMRKYSQDSSSNSTSKKSTKSGRQYNFIGNKLEVPKSDTYKKMKYINPPPPLIWNKGVPIDIPPDTPLYDLLNKEEIMACSILRILPSQYLRIREILLNGYEKNGYYLKKDAKKWCRGVDVNKTAKLYDWWVEIGWLPFKDIIIAEQQEKEEKRKNKK